MVINWIPPGLKSLKSKVDKLDVGKLVPVPVDLSKLNDDVVKETEYDELMRKVNAIQTADTSDLVRKTDYNTKTNEIKYKTIDHDHNK